MIEFNLESIEYIAELIERTCGDCELNFKTCKNHDKRSDEESFIPKLIIKNECKKYKQFKYLKEQTDDAIITYKIT